MHALAVSDTPISRRLMLGGRLDVDFFETSGPLTESAVRELESYQTPFLLHNGVWNWSLGDPAALNDPNVLEQTKARLNLTRAPWLSVHIGYSAGVVVFEEGTGFRPAPTANDRARLARDALLEVMTQNVRALQDAISVPLILENLDFNPTGAYDHVCDPSFVHDLLGATNVGLLLDLAHTQVSASRLGYTLEAFLAALPLGRVRQLHLSGPSPDGEGLVDAHLPLREADYELLEHVLARTHPEVVTLEYGKNEEMLLEQVTRLEAVLN